MSTRIGPADSLEALVYTCRSCGTDFAPECGECPDCGGWTFTAALSAGPPLAVPEPRSPGGPP